MVVITLIAPTSLDPVLVASLVERLGATNAERHGPRASDILLDDGKHEAIPSIKAEVQKTLQGHAVDAIVQPAENRRKKLLISDMDSTLIEQECIDELGERAGLKPQIAAITERAMRGELDFSEALRERVLLLEGVSIEAIARVLDNQISLSPGAAAMTATLKRHGVRTVLVSGGFTHFADVIAGRLGMDAAFANTLIVKNGKLTGEVAEPILGQDAKRERLMAECDALGIEPGDALALGDGANDLAMIKQAGLGLAYRGKPKVAAEADGAIEHCGLEAVLYAMGFSDADISA